MNGTPLNFKQYDAAEASYQKALSLLLGNKGIVLRSLARLWQAGQDPNLPAAVGAMLKLPVEQVEELLGKLNQG